MQSPTSSCSVVAIDNPNQLMWDLATRRFELLPAAPFLVKHEWYPHPPLANLGRGDLVFSSGRGLFIVVEVKHIDLDSTGRTARNRRTAKRKQVRVQASKYARIFSTTSSPSLCTCVLAAYFTNETPQVHFVAPFALAIMEASIETAHELKHSTVKSTRTTDVEPKISDLSSSPPNTNTSTSNASFGWIDDALALGAVLAVGLATASLVADSRKHRNSIRSNLPTATLQSPQKYL